MRISRTIDEMLALAILGPCRGQAEIRRWHSLYRTAAWRIWKAYLTYSFAQSCMRWVPESAAGSYRDSREPRGNEKADLGGPDVMLVGTIPEPAAQ
jgi:hypothetical protein